MEFAVKSKDGKVAGKVEILKMSIIRDSLIWCGADDDYSLEVQSALLFLHIVK